MNQAMVKRNPTWQAKYNCDTLVRSTQAEFLFFLTEELKLLEVKRLGRDPGFVLKEIVLLLHYIT